MLDCILGILLVFTPYEAASAQMTVCDPENILSIQQGQIFDRGLVTHAIMVAAGLPSDGDLLPVLNRTNYFTMCPCVRVVEPGSHEANRLVQSAAGGRCKSFPTTGIVSGLRSNYISHYIRRTLSNINPNNQVDCTADNTVSFILPGATRGVQMNQSIVVWTLLVIILLLLGVCWGMMAMDESKPDDLDDDFTNLLFNCPEMQLADESFLDDEPWEDGGLNY